MAQWYVKDLSKLTEISVQTLHYYDRINLLKPSLRLSNGYRVYSEKDLLRLQQIIALKFFGFELAQIKKLLMSDVEAVEHLSAQANLLEQKGNSLLNASNALKQVISTAQDNKSISWETIIKSIEVYIMTQNLDHSWVKEIFTPEELQQYATFETELKINSTPQQKAAFEKNWADLVEEIRKNLDKDPKSAIGVTLGEKCILLINGLYGKKYAHLRTKKFEKGFKQGKGLAETGLTPAMVVWLETAMSTYWRGRIYAVINQAGNIPAKELLQQWHELLTEIEGDDEERKKEIYIAAIEDEKVSDLAKQWLRSLM